MKKIGLVTMHRVKNYGSILQTYATQKIFEKLGCKVEVIDYYPRRVTFWGMIENIKNRNDKFKKSRLLTFAARTVLFPTFASRFVAFKVFFKKYINVSEKTYSSVEELYDNYPKCDAYCVGSDQVWNSEWNEKIDLPYYLGFLKEDDYRFAYSSSFGKSKLAKWEKEETKELLSKFKYLAVREQSAVEILKDLGLESKLVLDPTFLLTKEDWEKVASKKYNNKKYILMYNINRTPLLYDYAKKLAKEKKMKLINVSYNLHDFIRPGNLVASPKVADFLSAFLNAEYIITDSFHGTSFAINLNKKFATVYPKRFSTRLENILAMTNFLDRKVNTLEDTLKIDNELDYVSANKILAEKKEDSLNYLKMVLEDIDNKQGKKYVEKQYDCTGCGACEKLCPKGAINMVEDKEGFKYPVIDKEKCVNCKLCINRCHLNKKYENKFKQKGYAIQIKEESVLEESSSGGAFSAIANYVLKNKGYICGCTLDKNKIVKHIMISNKKDLYKLRGSKYVASDLKDSYFKVKEKLEKDKIILFVGTPCQVAGLKSYLNKEYEKLITVDFICHGTPSQKMFSEYIRWKENKLNKKIDDYKFRCKDKEWGLNYKIKTNDSKEKIGLGECEPYYRLFLNGENYREACYNCKYSNLDRVSDITLGDFWGIEKVCKFPNENKGVSAVLVNSKTGLNLLEKICSDIIVEEVRIEDILRMNKNLMESTYRPKNRNKEYEDLFKLYNERDKFNLKSYIKSIVPYSVKSKIKAVK